MEVRGSPDAIVEQIAVNDVKCAPMLIDELDCQLIAGNSSRSTATYRLSKERIQILTS
jgi:hypothetical protein